MKAWTIDESVFLVKHYSTMPLDELMAHLADFHVDHRSKDAIHARARALGILTKVRRNCSPLRDECIRILSERQEVTINELVEETGSPAGSIWKILDNLCVHANAHVVRYEYRHKNAATAIYRIGSGKAADKPWSPDAQLGDDPEPVGPRAIPMPQLGPWGCVWPKAPAEGLTT